MAVSLTYRFDTTVTETLSTSVPAADTPTVTHAGFNHWATLNASSTVPATTVVALTPTLIAGAVTIDLTSLTGTNGSSVDLTGLKVQQILFNNGTTSSGTLSAGTNAVVTIDAGATNGLDIFGSTGQVDVPPGGSIQMLFQDTLADVSASVKNIDLSGTGTDAYEMIIVAG